MKDFYKDKIESRERLSASIQTQINRIKRMDDSLYDDKLSGEITKGKYEEKHEQFESELEVLRAKLNQYNQSAGNSLDQKLVLLELSQKAAQLYLSKSPEQKRLIISKLFATVTIKGGILSVKYTKFAQAIAERVLETTNLMEVQK